MSERRRIYRPTLSSWLILLLAISPFAVMGLAAVWQGIVLEGVAALAASALITGYNATMRLEVKGHQLAFRRYGDTLWSTPLEGTSLLDGKGGAGNMLPAYVISHEGKAVGFLLRSWFSRADIADLRNLFSSKL